MLRRVAGVRVWGWWMGLLYALAGEGEGCAAGAAKCGRDGNGEKQVHKARK